MSQFSQKLSATIFFILLVASTLSTVQAQISGLEVIGTAENEMAPLANAKVTLFKNGESIQTVYTSTKGEFKFSMDVNSEYLIQIEKSGFYSKKIAFNTEIPSEIEGKWTMEFAMGLFAGCDGVNASALDDPVDRIKFSTNQADFISDEAYVRNMRGRIERLLMDIDQCQSDNFQDAISEGEKLANEGRYDEALKKYDEALAVYPDDRSTLKKISDVEKAMGQSQQDERAFNSAIAQADRLLAEKDYEGAKAKYNEALRAKPDTYARNKVTEITTIIREQQQTEQEQLQTDQSFNSFIAKANQAYTAKNYEAAQGFYAQALTVKPGAAFPKQKMAELGPLITAQKQDVQSQQAAHKAYTEAIAMGQSALQSEDFETAKQHFNRALMMKPQESFAKQMIAEVDQKINAQKAAQQKAQQASQLQQVESALDEGDALLAQKNYEAAEAAYKRALQIDPSDAYAKKQVNKAKSMQSAAQAQKQKTLEKTFNDAVDQGDDLLASASYQQAADIYKQALLQKPGDREVMSKLQEAEKKIASEQQKHAGEQAKRKEYDNYLAQANQLFTSKQYLQAKQAYQSAMNLYPDQSTPRNRIQEIDRLLADQNKQEQYKQLITSADELFSRKDYEGAKTTYQQAQSLIPSETYPKQKISEIDGLFQQAAQQVQQQKQRDAQYNRIILEADNLLSLSRLPEAKAAYQRALGVKSGEAYPQQQISKVDGLIAGQLQKANDQKALDQQYNTVITRADGLLASKDYAQAKASYQQALGLKSTETYPRQKIAEIDRTIQEQANQLADQQKQLDAQYSRTVQEADNLLSSSRLPEAKAAYQRALGIKSNETYPQQQISKIDGLIAVQLQKANDQKALDQQYNTIIARADGLLAGKDYTRAKESYQQALGLKSTETYPRQKIAEIDGKLREQEQLAAEQKMQDQQYSQTIQEADNLLNASKLPEAKGAYQRAMSIKANESYPASQITKIDAMIAEQIRFANDKKAKEQQYNLAITQADKDYNQNKLQDAKTGYQRATALKSGEAYPEGQIAKIDTQLAKLEQERQEKAAYELKYSNLIASADGAYDKRDYPSAKIAYTEALAMKPSDRYPQQRLNKIAEFERIIATQNANKQNAQTTTTTASKPKTSTKSKLAELNFANDSERNKYLNSLRSQYPEGVTLETHKEKTKTTSRYIVIRGSDVNEFRKVKFSWGVEFKQNGKPITGQYFESQVKTRSAEFFQEFNF